MGSLSETMQQAWKRIDAFSLITFGFVVIGALLGLFFGLAQGANQWSIAFYGFTIAVASAAVGGLFGLLFGIPRFAGQTAKKTPAEAIIQPGAAATPAPATAAPATGYAPNTNLEQVSDWLTKLLLGAGLTQIASVPTALRSLGDYLAPGLGSGHDTSSFAAALVVFNLLAGFFFGFFVVRLHLGEALSKEDEKIRQTHANVLSHPDPFHNDKLLPGEGLKVKDEQTDNPLQKQAALQLKDSVQYIEQLIPAPVFGVDEYRRLAQELVRVMQYSQAINLLELAMQNHSNDPSLPLYAGIIHGAYINDYLSAEQNYFKALSLQPNYAPAFYDLACNSARQYKEAEQKRLAEASTFLVQAYVYLERVKLLDPGLLEQSIDDPVWDHLELRNDERLADLLPTR